jgi:hypothetical protein
MKKFILFALLIGIIGMFGSVGVNAQSLPTPVGVQ